ncbi:MAG: hypothetical protein WC718_00555 [Phycisphaerales bacterium]
MQRAIDTIRRQLAGLSLTHWIIVACLATIAVLTLVIVGNLSSNVANVELLQSATLVEKERAASQLTGVGIDAKFQDGKLVVPSARALAARQFLAQAGALPKDRALYFETLITKQNWMNSRQSNEQNYRLALQNELSRMVEGFNGVESATVLMEIPEAQGLGSTMRKPTAAVSVKSSSGQSIPQSVIDGIANIIAGSVAGLTVDHINITDAGTGAKRAISSDESQASLLALDNSQRVERQAREKIEQFLSYIPGVQVAVTASVDVTRSVAEVQSYLPEKNGTVQLTKKTTTTTNNSNEAAGGAAVPGVEANQAADITRGAGGGGAKTENNDETVENENKFGSRTERIVDPKGQSTSVAVSVSVPKGYVVRLMQDSAASAANATPGAKPTTPPDADVQKKFDTDLKPSIIEQVSAHVRTMISQANAKLKPEELNKLVSESVTVAMIPADIPPNVVTQSASFLGGITGGGGAGGGGLISGGLIEKVALAVLSLIAMGMMLSVVKKAARKADTPTAEEIVGLPPALEGAAEVIGEADESETAMAGIEVGEGEMQAAKILEQVGELVEENPEGAAKLVSRWINVEE